MIRAEVLKLHTARAPYAFGAAAAVLVALGAASVTATARVSTLTGSVSDHDAHTLAVLVVAVFTTVLGVRASTDEYRYATVTWTALVVPDRGRVVVARAAAAGTAGAVTALACVVATVAVALVTSAARDGALELRADDAAAFAGLVAAGAGWAALGVGLGELARHQVPVIVGVVVWFLLLENLVHALAGDPARYLPARAGFGLAAAGVAGSPSALPGGLALAGWCVLALLLAARRFEAGAVGIDD